jgi:molecular chaperone HtpG
VALYAAQGIDVAVLDSMLDTQFIGCVEAKMSGVKFRRVDAELSDALKSGDAAENEALCDLFKAASGNDKLKVTLQKLKNADVPVMLNIPEELRRMQDTMRMYSLANGEDMQAELPLDATLVLNTDAPLVQSLSGLLERDAAKAKRLASYLWQLSLLSLRKLSAEEMQTFLTESYALLSELAQ